MNPPTHLPISIRHRQHFARASAAALLSLAQLGQSFAGENSVDFNKDILPVFAKNCVACHNDQSSEGGLNLESFSKLSIGGDSGAVLDASVPANSLLLERIADSDDPMPPDDNDVGAKRLSQDEIGRLRQWLEAGASPPNMQDRGSASVSGIAMQWSALAEDLRPIYALGESPDGSFLAYGSGNSVYVRQLATGNLQSLNDVSIQQPQTDEASQPASPQAHLDLVQSIAIRPDGQQIASGGFGVVKLWNRDFDFETLLSPLNREIRLAAFSPDGEHVACASSDSTVEIVSIAAGTIQTFLKSHRGKVTAITWTPDGHSVVTCDDSGLVVITHVRTGVVEQLISESELQIEQVVCIDSESYLVRTTDGSLHRISQADNVGSIELLADHQDVRYIWRSAGETPQLFAIDEDGELATLTLDSFEKQTVRSFPSAAVRSTASADGNRIVSVDTTGAVSLWSKGSDEPIASLDVGYDEQQVIRRAASNMERQEAVVKLLQTRLDANKKISEAELAAVAKAKPLVEAAQGSAEKQDIELDEEEAKLAEAKSALSQAEEELKVAAAEPKPAGDSNSLDAAKKLFETQKTALGAARKKREKASIELKRLQAVLANANRGATAASERLKHSERELEHAKSALGELQAEVETAKASASGASSLACICFGLDSSVIVLVHQAGTLDAFAAVDGRPVFSLNLQQPISGACESSGRLRVLTGGESASVESFRINPTWQLAKSIQLEQQKTPSRVTALAYSPSGNQLVAGSGPASRFGDLKTLDTTTGELQAGFGQIAEDTVLAAAYSPTGTQLLTGAADRLCRLYDVESGQLVRTFEGHSHHVLSVAWRADGASFASGSADGTIKVWNAETGEQFRTIASKQEIASVQFVGNSGQIVSCSADGASRLHSADDGKAVRGFSGPTDALYCVSVSPDGQFLYAAGQSGKVWRWVVESGKLAPLETDAAQ